MALAASSLGSHAQDVTFSADSLMTGTSAVSTVGGDRLYKVPAANLTNTFQGLFGGLTVNSGNGAPGDDLAGLLIRGIGTYGKSGAYNTAKIYIDGFETNLDFVSRLSPYEIKSVSILKDAAALATYGMKGGEGVIWIETNRGSEGRLKIDFQVRSGIQNAINVYKPLDSYRYATLYNQAYSNDFGDGDWTPYYSEQELDAYRSGTGTDVDWWDETMRDMGMYTDTDLAFHGGTENIKYNIVLGYANQQGLYDVKNTDNTSNIRMARYSARANLDIKFSKIFSASVDMAGRLQDNWRPDYETAALMGNIVSYPSNIYPVTDALVTADMLNYSGTAVYPDNPVASIRALGWTKNHTRAIQSNFRFKEDLDVLTKGLYLQEGVSFYANSLGEYSKTRNYARYFNGVAQTTDQTTSITASKFSPVQMERWIQGYVNAGYKRSFGKHNVNAQAGIRISDYQGEGQFDYRNHYLNQTGFATWSYDRRYVASFAWSCFGSDAYAGSGRWRFYPTISAAWIISNEKFMSNATAVDFLKLRLSVGQSGYADSDVTSSIGSFDTGGRYLYQQYYTSSQIGSFYTGNSAPFEGQSTLAPLFYANPDVTAETSTKYNVGIDMTLLKSLNVSVDAFIDKRTGILTQDNSIMGYYGNVVKFSNVGEMTNRGVELSVSYARDMGDIGFSVFGLVNYARNTIDYMAEEPQAHSYNAKTGRALGTRIGLECIGFYDLDDFDEDGNLNPGLPVPMFGTVRPGDLKYRDLDEDGYIDQTDVTKVGNPWYPFLNASIGGNLKIKGFDLTILVTGSFGGTVDLLDYPYYTKAFVNNNNAFPIAENAWAYYPNEGIDTRDSATYPRLSTEDSKNNFQASSFWVRKNNFIRIKTIELGYDFGQLMRPDSVISNLRIYLNAMNPFTFSSVLKDYGMDPESYFGYPALKSWNFGLQLSF